jgi:hypothetical protein
MNFDVTLYPYAELRTVLGPLRLFELTADFVTTVDGNQITVPRFFITDFASVPRWAQSVVQNDEPDILRPALLHDYLYQQRGVVSPLGPNYTREDCDAILRDAMKTAGSSWWKRHLVWLAVRVGGGVFWNQPNRKNTLKATASDQQRTFNYTHRTK